MTVRNNNRFSQERCLKCSSYVVVPYKPAKEGETKMFMALCIMGNAILALCKQVVVVCFTRRQMMCDFMVNLSNASTSP